MSAFISESMARFLAEQVQWHRYCAAEMRRLDTPVSAAAYESLASELEMLAGVAALVDTDERLRDALTEAMDRQATPDAEDEPGDDPAALADSWSRQVSDDELMEIIGDAEIQDEVENANGACFPGYVRIDVTDIPDRLIAWRDAAVAAALLAQQPTDRDSRDRAAVAGALNALAALPDGAPVPTRPAVAEGITFETVPRVCNACGEPATRFAEGELWCEPCHDMTGPGAVNLVPVDEEPECGAEAGKRYSTPSVTYGPCALLPGHDGLIHQDSSGRRFRMTAAEREIWRATADDPSTTDQQGGYEAAATGGAE